jgi:NADP-dependent 3-hydroxy acid dehydrogenase YdfG
MKTMFITGAAMGIGRATAEHFYNAGWSLGLADKNIKDLETFAQGKDATRIQCFDLDVRDYDAVKAAFAQFCEAHDHKLNALINNAGVLQVGNFEDIDIAQHRLTIDVNVNGLINCTHAAFPYLKQTQSACVINLSSASSNYGVPELSSYSASKFAVKAMTEALNIEWEKYGIIVCDVVPPFVNTHMLDSQAVTSSVLSRMGAHLVADDVVRTIVQQVDSPKLHRPVGWRYAILHHISSISPSFLSHALMRHLSR